MKNHVYVAICERIREKDTRKKKSFEIGKGVHVKVTLFRN